MCHVIWKESQGASNLAPSMTDEDTGLQKREGKCLRILSHSLGRHERPEHHFSTCVSYERGLNVSGLL